MYKNHSKPVYLLRVNLRIKITQHGKCTNDSYEPIRFNDSKTDECETEIWIKNKARPVKFPNKWLLSVNLWIKNTHHGQCSLICDWIAHMSPYETKSESAIIVVWFTNEQTNISKWINVKHKMNKWFLWVLFSKSKQTKPKMTNGTPYWLVDHKTARAHQFCFLHKI